MDIKNVDHPAHYNMGKYEVIDVVQDWQLDFCLGNAVKYIARAFHKEDPEQDLNKAIWYINRELQTLQKPKEKKTTTKKQILNEAVLSAEEEFTDILENGGM